MSYYCELYVKKKYLYFRDWQNIYGNGTIPNSIIFGKKSLECSIYDQKWVILGPSVQKSINK